MSDSSASTIILLASAAIIGTILCISITIAIVKRKHRNHDDEAVLSPSRDNAEMDNNRACTLEQLPAFVLGVADETDETSATNEQQSPTRSLSNEQSSHVNGHVDAADVHLHGQRAGSYDNGASRMNGITMGEHNLAITDVNDTDNENYDTFEGVRAPKTDAAATDRRARHSGSILTSTKVIYVQDSSSSRCSTRVEITVVNNNE